MYVFNHKASILASKVSYPEDELSQLTTELVLCASAKEHLKVSKCSIAKIKKSAFLHLVFTTNICEGLLAQSFLHC